VEQYKFKLWVDDTREPPDDTWIWAKKISEAWRYLQNVIPSIISLDHDLGEPEPGYGMENGYDLLIAMFDAKRIPDQIYIHTMNPVAKMRMEKALIDYRKHERTLMYDGRTPECIILGDRYVRRDQVSRLFDWMNEHFNPSKTHIEINREEHEDGSCSVSSEFVCPSSEEIEELVHRFGALYLDMTGINEEMMTFLKKEWGENFEKLKEHE
jgi:hypothetical protein